jgi:cyclic pyranopterin phosphate synthase
VSAERTPIAGCGLHTVDYLRLAVTDRCNLRCVYCMPSEGVPFKQHDEILSYEDMAYFVAVAVDVGISKVRLTGGEPLVRKGVPDLVRLIAATAGVDDISLTTNGLLLASFASALVDAGLSRVNVSLDSLDPARFRTLTRGGSVEQALDGVRAALESGFHPVKVNAVLMPETLTELEAFVALTRERPIHVRFIEWMPLGGCGPQTAERPVTKDEALAVLRSLGELVPVASPGGWGPARYFRFPRHEGTVGFISSVSDHFCDECNRLRLTADGRLKNCLFSDDEVDVRPAVRARDREATLAAIQASLRRKTFDKLVLPGRSARGMSQIGG